LTALDLTINSRWLLGPEFLYLPEQCWPQPPCTLPMIPEEFLILRKTVYVTSTSNSDMFLNDRFSRFSSWYRLKRSVAWILRLKKRLLKRPTNEGTLTVSELNNVKNAIIQCVQNHAFAKEINELKCNSENCVHKSSPLRKLSPILFKGILRVGGRIDRALCPLK